MKTVQAHWFNGTSIYRMLLESVVEFNKENYFPVAIKFDIEISTVLKNAKWQQFCHLKFIKSKSEKSKRKEKQAC